ncbi:hypothetical protein HU200_029086 [Digitaria exilis]|uniref:Dof zinc finger protein n=1 Tax=Digitaria exilis TaxID=1010633 RepID=A0A835BYQ7_9POAL|nr:hypothetical protein HU200_029086 [Digitaria exilis]
MMASQTNEEVVAASNTKAKQARQQVAAPSVSGERKPRPKLDRALNCPRCDSTNTKFCYYNNYSVTQPRYYCKACHRYWTQGGILRNVPVGGGSRKNNKQQRAFVAAAALGSAPTSASSSSSGSSKKINTNMPQLMKMPTTAMATSTDFPNVLPTLMSSTSSGLELPSNGGDHQHQVSLPFAPLSLPSNPPGNNLFMDAMRGGFLGDSGSSSRGMMPLPFLPPPSFGFGVMQLQGHGVLMGGSSSTDQQQNPVGPLLQGQGVQQEVRPPMAAAAAGVPWVPTARGVAQHGHQHQVGDAGGDGGSNNHHNSRGFCVDWQVGGGGGGSLI